MNQYNSDHKKSIYSEEVISELQRLAGGIEALNAILLGTQPKLLALSMRIYVDTAFYSNQSSKACADSLFGILNSRRSTWS